MLLQQLSSLRFLTRQGLAVQGHTNEEGNLYQLLKCRAQEDRKFQLWLKEGKYQSPEIINEQIQLFAHTLLWELLAKIHEARFYSIIADETRDISGAEQLAISLK